MQITIPVTIGTSNAGQPLEATLVNDTGVVQGGWPLTTGFAMDGSTGTWTGDVPDGWRGAIRIRRQSDHVTLMTYALDPTPASSTGPALTDDQARKLDEIHAGVQS